MSTQPAIYADGGVVGRNPSPLGGTWAWCLVDADGAFSTGRSGAIVSSVAGDAALVGAAFPLIQGPVTNNLAEFVALVMALEHLPAGWGGRVCSDSQVTLGRLFGGWRLTGIPAPWVERGAAAVRRLCRVEPILLQGHPTRADLEAGIGAKRLLPVSEWNVWCDRECGAQAAAYLRHLARRCKDAQRGGP